MSFDFDAMADPIIPVGEVDDLRRKQYEAFDGYFTRLIEEQETRREHRWQRDYSSEKAYVASVAPNRERFLSMLGGRHWERGELNPRVEALFETEHYRCERVFITPFEGVEVDCLVLTPPGDEPRPAILCQHGLGGCPELACGFCPTHGAPDYNAFGIRMAMEGWVVFAPRMLSGYGREEYSEIYVPPHDPQRDAVLRARTRIYRKAMQMGMRLFGTEMFVLSRFVDYIETLPSVIPDRIGLYGLSQGGQTALMFPAVEQRIKATVCSAYFNWRMKKQVVPDPRGRYVSYIDTTEEEKFFYGHLLEFSDSDVVSLIAPRAFMAEVGKLDRAVYWEYALEEFAKAKEHYARLGIADKCEVCVHEGGHECRCIESFEFLRKWV